MEVEKQVKGRQASRGGAKDVHWESQCSWEKIREVNNTTTVEEGWTGKEEKYWEVVEKAQGMEGVSVRRGKG